MDAFEFPFLKVLNSITVVLKFYCASEFPEGIVKTQIAGSLSSWLIRSKVRSKNLHV